MQGVENETSPEKQAKSGNSNVYILLLTINQALYFGQYSFFKEDDDNEIIQKQLEEQREIQQQQQQQFSFDD